MADEENLEQTQPVVLSVNVDETNDAAPAEGKRRRPATRKNSSARANATRLEPKATKARSRRYSESERSQKLTQIEERLSSGETLKSAAKDAGISEQTYYQWRRAIGVAEVPATKAQPSAGIGTLADLVALEQENIRLRVQLAERLRAENAELRKRLGLDQHE